MYVLQYLFYDSRKISLNTKYLTYKFLKVKCKVFLYEFTNKNYNLKGNTRVIQISFYLSESTKSSVNLCKVNVTETSFNPWAIRFRLLVTISQT